MYKLWFCKTKYVRLSPFSFIPLLLFIIMSGFSTGSFAQGHYSAAEQIYLKNSTPLLYEFSQLASGVTSTVLPLESAPPEECSAKFADYRGIINSLTKELGSMTPPPKLLSVHEKSMQALRDYSSGLNLYYKACSEEDYGVKESLVSRGGAYLNNSVAAIGSAYDEIEHIKSERAAAASEVSREEITESELTESGMSGENAAQTHGAEGVREKAQPQKVKSTEEVIKEISHQVESKKEPPASKKTTVAMPVKKVQPKLAGMETQSGSSQLVPGKKVIEVKAPQPAKPVETPAPKLQVPDSEAAEMKTVEVNKTDETGVQQQKAEPPAGEKGTEAQDETGKKMSDKERVQKLNQKIMERAGIDQGKTASEGKETAKVGAFPAAPEDRGENVSPQTAVVPPGGVPGETKEDKGPVDDIKSWCLDRYQTPSEQDSCVKSRAVAKDKTEKLMNEYSQGTKERKVLDKCVNDWKYGDTYNYQMIISCTQFYCKQGGIEKCENLIK